MLRLRRITAFLPVLAVLFALSGIAAARAGAERLAVPDHFALCLGGETSGSPHDCVDCGLPTLSGAPHALRLAPLAHVQGQALALIAPSFGLDSFTLAHPLSRGPPGFLRA